MLVVVARISASFLSPRERRRIPPRIRLARSHPQRARALLRGSGGPRVALARARM